MLQNGEYIYLVWGIFTYLHIENIGFINIKILVGELQQYFNLFKIYVYAS